jgi:hypothetical protein
MARCKSCYLEFHPGDKNCRRCGAPVDRSFLTWRLVVIALVCSAVPAGIVLFFLNR